MAILYCFCNSEVQDVLKRHVRRMLTRNEVHRTATLNSSVYMRNRATTRCGGGGAGSGSQEHRGVGGGRGRGGSNRTHLSLKESRGSRTADGAMGETTAEVEPLTESNGLTNGRTAV